MDAAKQRVLSAAIAEEELHRRTLVRRIKEHYTGKFGTGFEAPGGSDTFSNGLLSLGGA